MPQPWFDSLTASVSALGAAAREARSAHQAAQLACETWNPGRIVTGGGRCTRPGLVHDTAAFHPHDSALSRITRASREYRDTLYLVFNMTALAYADGAAWAIGQVQNGEQPPAVHGRLTEDGWFTVPGPLHQITLLERWSGWKAYVQAEIRVNHCATAESYGEMLAAADQVSEQEAAEMFTAYREAAELPDAALAFGAHAESALAYVLLDARHRATATGDTR